MACSNSMLLREIAMASDVDSPVISYGCNRPTVATRVMRRIGNMQTVRRGRKYTTSKR